MEIQLFHFTRIPGCIKINNLNKCRKFPPTSKFTFPFFLHHYQYLEETRPIRQKTLVIFDTLQ
jgi:hypothetical protein